MTLDAVVARKWPGMAPLLDRHGLHARFEVSDECGTDDSIDVSLGDEDVGSIQVMDAGDYDDVVDRYVAGVWTSRAMEARAYGPVRDDAVTACTDLVGLAELHHRIAAA